MTPPQFTRLFLLKTTRNPSPPPALSYRRSANRPNIRLSIDKASRKHPDRRPSACRRRPDHVGFSLRRQRAGTTHAQSDPSNSISRIAEIEFDRRNKAN